MRILICSDGNDPADKPARLGGLLAGPCKATVTLLGIIERPPDEESLRAALDSEAKLLREFGVAPKVHVRAGEPIEEILKETTASAYDLVIIGAPVKRTSGQYWRSQRTYEVIKAIPVPVLVAAGECERLSSLLVCTGGKRYIEAAVQLTAEIAACVGASVTLLHVMAEPPAIYLDLVQREEDVDALLASGSELGRNLQMQKATLVKMGVPTHLRIRHGIVLEQVFEELREGEHDLIVTGSSRAHGALRHYIMGDLTRSIVNRAPCPVLVARPGKEGGAGDGIWDAIKRAFSSPAA
jgi:nucleotide-binding universal stress UspA family protein